MNVRYHVELSEAERCELTALVGSGKHYARKIKRAQILLVADSGLSDEEIAARLQVLADSDRIEGIGDLRKWRHSEVRLKD